MELKLAVGRSIKAGLIEAVAEHMIQKLNLTKSKWQVIITQESVRKDGHDAFVTAMAEHRIAIVTLHSTLDAAELIQCLSHEMVHVKQFATGKLRTEKYRNKMHHVWLGKRISKKVHYYDQPWEQQAYAMAQNLANSFYKKHATKESK